MAATVRQRPTRRQLEVLRAYVATGSIAAAAQELDIAESTARQHLSALYRATRCLNAVQAAYLLGAQSRGIKTLLDPRRDAAAPRATPPTTVA